MITKSRVALKILLQHYHRDKIDQLLSFLPGEEQQKLQALPCPEAKPQDLFLSGPSLIQGVHYSWLAEKLEQCPESLRSKYLSTLSSPQAELVAKLLNTPFAPEKQPPFIAAYLAHEFSLQLRTEPILPQALLPPRPLNKLLKLEKQNLVKLIGFLGLHDVAAELKTILERTIKEKIYRLLAPTQLSYLESCLRQQNVATGISLGLRTWDGDPHQFERLLQTCGLSRLGKALANENRSLLWHICHHLDSGRGKLLIKHAKERIEPSVSFKFAAQIEQLMKYLSL